MSDLPAGWKLGKVSDLIKGLESGVSVNGEDREFGQHEKVVLKVSAVSYGFFDPKAAKVIQPSELHRAKVNPKKGQIIISRSNTETLVGASVFIDRDHPNLFLPDKLWQTIPRKNIEMKWLSYFLSSQYTRYRLSKLATGTSGSMKNITKGELFSLKVLIPPLPEQRKIAQILSTWDKAIATTQKRIANSKQQKKALMQQLLTGKKRLAGFSEDWEEYHLIEVAKINKGKALSSKNVISGKYPVIAGGKTSPYSHNQFSHQNIITVSASGAYAGYVSIHRQKVWASDCSVIEQAEKSNLTYLYYFLKLNQKKIYSLQSGGAQPHIYPKDLGVLNIKLPPLPEQQKIAQVLTTADKEISALETQLAHLQQEKKALMQQLLTGKKRVVVEEG